MLQIASYNGKFNLLLEGVRYNARRISWRWAVLRRTAHCRDNSLAEVDDPLSRQSKIIKAITYRISFHILTFFIIFAPVFA